MAYSIAYAPRAINLDARASVRAINLDARVSVRAVNRDARASVRAINRDARASIRVINLDARASILGPYRRMIFSGAVGAATVTTPWLIAAALALAAAFMTSASQKANSVIRAKAPMGLEAVAVAKLYGRLPEWLSSPPQVLGGPGDS